VRIPQPPETSERLNLSEKAKEEEDEARGSMPEIKPPEQGQVQP